MKKESKWDEANGQFLDFINDLINKNPDKDIIKKSGHMLSYFSHFIISIEESDEPEFRYFYQFIVTVDESVFSTADKQKITSKLLEVIRIAYPDFYTRYNFFDL